MCTIYASECVCLLRFMQVNMFSCWCSMRMECSRTGCRRGSVTIRWFLCRRNKPQFKIQMLPGNLVHWGWPDYCWTFDIRFLLVVIQQLASIHRCNFRRRIIYFLDIVIAKKLFPEKNYLIPHCGQIERKKYLYLLAIQPPFLAFKKEKIYLTPRVPWFSSRLSFVLNNGGPVRQDKHLVWQHYCGAVLWARPSDLPEFFWIRYPEFLNMLLKIPSEMICACDIHRGLLLPFANYFAFFFFLFVFFFSPQQSAVNTMEQYSTASLKVRLWHIAV